MAQTMVNFRMEEELKKEMEQCGMKEPGRNSVNDSLRIKNLKEIAACKGYYES